jgi:hypothetical protein
VRLSRCNGTFLDGKRVNSNGVRITAQSRELDLANVLKMAIAFHGSQDKDTGSVHEKLSAAQPGPLWDVAGKAEVDSVTLTRLGNLGPKDENGCEMYCLVYRLATIGSARSCALRVTDRGLQPVHAAIAYLDNVFYLENLSNLTDVLVNERTLSRNELIPLNFGDRIHISRLEMEVRKCSQLLQ